MSDTPKPQPPALASYDLIAVLDRFQTPLPTHKCAIHIFKDQEWIACEWNPRTPETQTDESYLGTARTVNRPIQIGFHAWAKNEHEFRYFCISENAGAVATASTAPRKQEQ
jgi:hypothetical protein